MIISALAPAKLNLGLAVLGRRGDGFHEIRSVLVTVSIFDRITIADSDRFRFRANLAQTDDEQNLAARAVIDLSSAMDVEPTLEVTLAKRIPAAAGLGGASSDAAATLVAASHFPGLDPSPERLGDFALSLGSDVPFFLRGGTALIEGRGERITQLPPLPSCWFVVVVPPIRIPRKTATLYGALRTFDFDSGAAIEMVADSIRSGTLPEPGLLRNSFERALLEIAPGSRATLRAFQEAGVDHAHLSGAGPAHYAVVRDLRDAVALARRIRRGLTGSAILVCRTAGETPILSIATGRAAALPRA